MSARIKASLLLLLGISQPLSCIAAVTPLNRETIANELGWVPSSENNCGGYFLDQPFLYPDSSDKKQTVGLTGSQAVFSQHGTTILEGNVSLLRLGQQITANKAYIYRDQSTGKITSTDLVGNVHFREPNTMVIAKRGHYDFKNRSKSLFDILYRTSLANGKQFAGPKVSSENMQKERKILALTAWGKADEFAQSKPKVYELNRSSFSTCPPTNPSWHVNASHIVLNKNIGRGYATNARFYIKSVPVFYIPYLNFSIDHKRKSGFLWPTIGNKPFNDTIYTGWGYFFTAPFYWNMAPNYDMTITPAYLSLRGIRFSDKFRYLTDISSGTLDVSVLPEDRLLKSYKAFAVNNYSNNSDPIIQAELQRLINSNTTRRSLSWRDNTVFNDHWSTHIDFNYAGDDYILRDFGNDISESTQNQILQEGDLYYKSRNWNFIGRLQTYQTLHPINTSNVINQYRRAPQLILNGDYPDQKFGLEYFINTEATRFDIRNTPGITTESPIGNRFLVQPGISLPVYLPYFFINPRAQLHMRSYNLYQMTPSTMPSSNQRSIPIFDMAMGFAFNRDMSLFGQMYQQTLEPQVYYVYIPYRNQASIPIFDTTVSTLTYDQIFNYNRFIGIDRIGDANQIGVGISSRMLESETGYEKVRMGVGEIIYFSNRRVTFCNDTSCTDNPFNPANHWRLSPISGLINYAVNPAWKLESNVIFEPIGKQLSNTTIGVHYKPDERHIVNLGYSYVFSSDRASPLSGATVSSAQNNLKLTDFSFSWPLSEGLSAVGRWSQNWNQEHLQNLMYGLQYDTCCWAVRIVGGNTFISLDPTQNNAPKYNPEFYIQFALKGLGDFGSGNPSGLLSSITGYNTQFGQEF
ncbi:MAG TPA: LPS assembly protein LptD [Gammaproteobacteria bacterium]|jgi:LPS-assembly protein|nr:LPS assembly protein LptD [Gammaproteobacteria bacterium]